MNEPKKKVSLPLALIDRLRIGQPGVAVLILLASALLFGFVLPAYAASGHLIAHNTPAYVASATNLGAADSSQTIEISIWLQPHNRSGLDALARNLYNHDSSNYRHWLKSSEIASRFAPTTAEATTVQNFFESNNLKVVSVGPDNFYVRAQGTIANVESAFQVQLNNYQVGNQILRANASDPYVEGPAAVLVQAVSGLDNGGFEHPLDLQTTLSSTSSSVRNRADLSYAVSAADSNFFGSVCFTGPKTENYTTLACIIHERHYKRRRVVQVGI